MSDGERRPRSFGDVHGVGDDGDAAQRRFVAASAVSTCGIFDAVLNDQRRGNSGGRAELCATFGGVMPRAGDVAPLLPEGAKTPTCDTRDTNGSVSGSSDAESDAILARAIAGVTDGDASGECVGDRCEDGGDACGLVCNEAAGCENAADPPMILTRSCRRRSATSAGDVAVSGAPPALASRLRLRCNGDAPSRASPPPACPPVCPPACSLTLGYEDPKSMPLLLTLLLSTPSAPALPGLDDTDAFRTKEVIAGLSRFGQCPGGCALSAVRCVDETTTRGELCCDVVNMVATSAPMTSAIDGMAAFEGALSGEIGGDCGARFVGRAGEPRDDDTPPSNDSGDERDTAPVDAIEFARDRSRGAVSGPPPSTALAAPSTKLPPLLDPRSAAAAAAAATPLLPSAADKTLCTRERRSAFIAVAGSVDGSEDSDADKWRTRRSSGESVVA